MKRRAILYTALMGLILFFLMGNGKILAIIYRNMTTFNQFDGVA